MNVKILLSIIIAYCSLLPGSLHAKDRLKANLQDLAAGNGVSVDISLENHIGKNYTAFQMDIYVPESYEMDTESVSLSSRLMGHSVSAAYHAEGFYRIMAWSSTNAVIVGNSGSIFTFHLVEKATEHDAVAKTVEVNINNIRFSTRNAEESTLPDISFTIEKKVPTYVITYLIDEEVYHSESLEEGSRVTPPNAPEKEGHTFSGWADLPEVMPAHDVTVNGTFTVNSYTATFKIDEDIVESKTIEYNQPVVAPQVAEKEGHHFTGWENLPELMPAHDIEVIGHYEANVYKLTYIVDDEVYKQIDVVYGANIQPEAHPEKEGHTFSGWADLPEVMPAHDVTVNGTFTINSYLIEYYLDGSFYDSQTVVYNDVINAPEVIITEANRVFLGWEDLPERMPAHDLKIYGATYVDGIQAVNASIEKVKVYDIQGKFIGIISHKNLTKQLKPGIYVINNKKILIK